MNNAELVWRLVELLLQKDNGASQAAPEPAQTDTTPNNNPQNEV